MRVSLKGLFANIVNDTPRSMREYYRFSLDEVYQHLVETVSGKHTVAEFSEHYCITAPEIAAAVELPCDVEITNGQS